MKTIIRFSLVMLLFAIALNITYLPSTSAHHAVLRFNVEEMVATADRVFIGKCIDVKESEEMIAQGMFPVTTYTFAVSKTLKGDIPKVFTFKQHGHRGRKPNGKQIVPLINGKVADPGSYVHGMSYYQVGDEMMLMLIPPYMEGKLTYPAGLYQGAFYISHTKSGQAMIKNSINNQGLFTNPYNNYKKSAADAKVIFPEADQPIAQQPTALALRNQDTLTSKPGALPLDDFVKVISAIVDTEKK